METATRNRTIGALVIGAIILVLLLFSCSVGLGGKNDGEPRSDSAPTTATPPADPTPQTTPKPKKEPDDTYVPPGVTDAPVVPEDDNPIVPVDNPVPEQPTCKTDPRLCEPEPTCETDPSLCEPEPTCETDPSLCEPEPTCETDPSLCEPPADTTPPTCPPNLAVSHVDAREAMAIWDRSTDNVGVTGYTVFLDGNVVGYSKDGQFLLQDLNPATEYTVRVVARDAAGNVSANCGSVTFRTNLLPDLLPPTVPGNVACTTVDETTIEVTFDESTDNVRVDHYTVYANGTSAGDFNKSPAQVTGLDPATDYAIEVTATDGAGNTSGRSQTVTCTTQADEEPPTTPTKVTVVDENDDTIDLSWTASTDNVKVDHYEVYVDGTLAGTTTSTTYTATGLTPETTYSFTVVAVDTSDLKSAESTAVTGTTLAPDTTAPSVPTGLTASNVGQTSFDVSWNPSTDDQDTAAQITYEVFVNGTSVGTVTGSTTYTVSGRLPGTTYSVTVTAADEAGNTSAQSDALSVTTAPLISLPLLRQSATAPTEEPTPTEEATPTQEPSPTEETTPTEEPTPTESPTPTEEPSTTIPESTVTPEPTPTEEPTPSPEPSPTTSTTSPAAREETTTPTEVPTP